MKKSLKGRSYPREKAKKVLRMMKISVVLMLFCLQIQANVYSCLLYTSDAADDS